MRFKQYLAEATHYGSLVDPDKYKRLDSHDKALYKYTADGFTHLSADTIARLVKRYPFDGGTIYRGFHFDDQEDHDNFLAKIKDGVLETTSFSSWTTHAATAEDFAHSKKTYFPTMSIMMAHDKMNKEGEHMSGYGGVVIETKIGPKVGVDVRQSDFSKEDEVILPAGNYDVKIVKLTEPFKRKYNSIEKVREFLKELKKAKERDDEHNKMMDFLIKSWLPKLEEADADIIMKYQLVKFLKMSKEELREKYSDFSIDTVAWRNNNHRLNFRVYVPVDNRVFSRCSDGVKKQVLKQIAQIAAGAKDKILQVVEHPKIDEIEEFNIDGMNALSHYLPDLAKDITQPLRMVLGKRYHQMNSREVNKSIKDMDALRAHSEKIASVVQAMASL